MRLCSQRTTDPLIRQESTRGKQIRELQLSLACISARQNATP